MIYKNYAEVPKGKIVWGCAYETSYNEKSLILKKLPVRGVIKGSFFYEVNKYNVCKKSGAVRNCSRAYADTYEESVQLYNSRVMEQVNFLKSLITDCESNLIKVEGGISNV